MNLLRIDAWQHPYYGLRPEETNCELPSLNALSNAAIPINRLPTELMVEIFSVVQMDEARELEMRWLSIPRVCRRWYWIAATTPDLWRWLYATSSLNYMKTCLVRSKDRTVSVVTGSTWIVPSALQLVSPQFHRVRHLQLAVGRRDAPVLNVILGSRMSVLEALEVTVIKTLLDTSEMVMEFYPERFPVLSELHLVGVHLLPSGVLRQLKVLSIHDWFGMSPGLTLDALSSILRELTNVERLTLCDIICHDHETPPAPSIAPDIYLPKLKAFTLDSLTSVMKHVLSALSIPPSARVVIRRAADSATESTEELSAQGVRVVLPVNRSSLPILSNITKASLGILESEHTIQGSAPPTVEGEDGGSFLCSLETPEYYDGPPLLLDDFVDVFRHAPLEALHITVDVNLAASIDWRTALVSFPYLRELTVSGTTEDGTADPIFSALDPENAPPSTSSVLCPRLRTLRIEGFGLAADAFLAAARRCLARRRDVLGDPDALAELSFGVHPDGDAEP
ncbi:hypothetical protein OH77DRAFT_1013467 [Trametes cingulata]|nr:hypothetical protein OH77DRAFT_1013467 [Trametes cingulata]